MKVKVYSTEQCPYCHMAKDYLAAKGVPFDDINVGEDRDAANEMIEKSGQMGVPVLDIGGDIIVGFDVPRIDAALAKGTSAKPRKVKVDALKKIYDAIVIGGSAAGLTAAMYASRRNLKTLVIAKDVGGQISVIKSIENYPGFEQVQGSDLVKSMKAQAEKSGAEIVERDAVELNEAEGDGGQKLFVVKACGGDKCEEHLCKMVILAMGKTPRSLGVPGEEGMIGRGVSYCVTCDAPLFKGKDVAVVGGGNSAIDAALVLSPLARKVYIVHRRGEFRAFEHAIAAAKGRKNVEFVLDSLVTAVSGKKFVESISVENKKTGKKSELKVEGVFVEIGSDVNTKFVSHLVELDENGQVKTGKNGETSHAGIFAAGDVTDTPFKQIVVAAGDGCKAALSAYNHVHGFESRYMVDWSKQNSNK
ncbi:MAG: FAD-dependent oxidoreductase [Candidatus Aenigmarchaeota archaeon]|nr:FAD-dependent oxidoreductase [Candidatus Aenigmarchaeota archaeon]